MVRQVSGRQDSNSWQRRAAVAAFVLIAVLYVTSIVVFARVGPWDSTDWADAIGYTFWLTIFTAVGVIIAFHRPGNAIAWICLTYSGIWALGTLLESFLAYESTHPGTLSRPDLVAALLHPYWVPGVGLIGFLLLLFPDGHLPSPRWRPVAWLLAGVMAILTLTGFFLPGTVQDTVYVNPMGVDALEPFDQGTPALVLILLLVLCLFASAVSVVVRYRRATGTERLQLKWLMAAGLVAAVAYVLIFVWRDTNLQIQVVWAFIPIAIAMSVHRHRLYDIDRLISRTVTYAVVAGIIAMVFIGAIFVLQEVLGADGPVGVAFSTLAAAAVFNPLRKRVQDRVDRRFNRSRYDAIRVADGFAGGLRDETDSHRIVQGWIDVVAETMQPTGVGVWMKEG